MIVTFLLQQTTPKRIVHTPTSYIRLGRSGWHMPSYGVFPGGFGRSTDMLAHLLVLLEHKDSFARRTHRGLTQATCCDLW